MSIKDLKKREKENRREYIIDEAEKCFLEHGFDDVTMEDIAREVGVDRTTLYLYFRDKEALFFAVVLRGHRILHAMITGAGNTTTDHESQVLSMMDASIAYMEKYPGNYRLQRYFISGRFDLSKTGENDELREIFRLRREIYIRFSQIIQEGIDAGVFRKEIPARKNHPSSMTSGSGTQTKSCGHTVHLEKSWGKRRIKRYGNDGMPGITGASVPDPRHV